MESIDSTLARFIQSFENNSASGDISEVVQQFAETFLAAGPDGSKAVRSVDFAAFLPKRKELFNQLGYQSRELISMKESWLNNRYALAFTEWRFLFRSPGGEIQPIDVASTFLVDTGSEPFRILLYMAHQDIIEIINQRRRSGAS